MTLENWLSVVAGLVLIGCGKRGISNLSNGSGLNTCTVHGASSCVRVRVQKYSSDVRFTPKMYIFKQIILNTAYIKIVEIFLSTRESSFIQTSTYRSVRNQSCLQCS